jgi:hypothetical protein
MSSPELYLSFNEIMFYFTRAAAGAGVPFGLAEDFGRAAIWIAGSGLDPSGITSDALNELECGHSCLKTSLTEVNKEILLTAEGGKQLSAIQAGAALCDLISAQPENSKNMQSILAENVDCPFLVCAAIGAANYDAWEISWQASEEIPCSVLICEDGSWKSSWKGREIPEQVAAADVKILTVNNCEEYYDKWDGKTVYSGNNKKQLLETGVPVYESWSVIYSYFTRCLVPSTEESRKTGAGAGLVDTD